jgi:dimethylargininase
MAKWLNVWVNPDIQPSAISHQPCRSYYARVHALTRAVSAGLAACELTHLDRVPIDVELARRQHAAYEAVLRAAGYVVERLDATPDMPDSVFIEDIGVVFDDVAIITRPGAVSRRSEIPAVADAVSKYRRIEYIEAPATIDGGDVLTVGRRVFVGRSTRTNAEAVVQMRGILDRVGYTVCEIPVGVCLHLKSAVTALADDLLLINPAWTETRLFPGFAFVEVDPAEPMAANALRLADRIVFPSAFPRTADRIARAGLHVEQVDASELAKAEGGVTCCSLLIES